ncbi:MAG: hypothetical protein V4801_33405, partial [Burkholderia gladioli]
NRGRFPRLKRSEEIRQVSSPTSGKIQAVGVCSNGLALKEVASNQSFGGTWGHFWGHDVLPFARLTLAGNGFRDLFHSCSPPKISFK